MPDHRVVLLQGRERLSQLGMRPRDRGEQLAVFAAMVPVECRAEPVAVQQQVACGRLGRFAAFSRRLRDVESFP